MEHGIVLDRAPLRYRGFTLDPFQQEAIAALQQGLCTLVAAPTGTGKTLIADHLIEHIFASGGRVVYTAPIKALSNQKFKEFKRLLGADAVGILTGDVVVNPDAPVAIMTTEVFRNLLHLRPERIRDMSWVIFDEIHYIDDPERGSVWEESLLFLPEEVRFLGLSATIPNAGELARWVESVQGRPVHVVSSSERAVPLEHHFFEPTLGITDRERLERHARRLAARGGQWRRGRWSDTQRAYLHYPAMDPIAMLEAAGESRLPALVFLFSRRQTEYYAHEMAARRSFLDVPSRARLHEVVAEVASRYPPGTAARLEPLVPLWEQGVGFHHAGLLPVLKDATEELFERRLLPVLFCTETFAVGVNFPCRSVFFGALHKFDGNGYRLLSNREYFQMAGRAGRRGIDERGYVYAGVDLNEVEIDRLPSFDEADVEPLRSQFTLTYNTVLNLVRRFADDELRQVLQRNFAAYQARRQREELEQQLAEAQGHLAALEGAGGHPKAVRRAQRRIAHLRQMIRQSPGPEHFEREYERRREVLTELDYLRGHQLTSRGDLASRIHVQELLVTELLCEGYFHGLDPAQLLAVMVSIDYEPRRYGHVPTPLPVSVGPITEVIHRIGRAERRALGYETLRFAPHLMRAAADWARGKSLGECILGAGVDEGDFVFATRRGIDLLRQLRTAGEGDPFLEQVVAETIRAADRDEVAVIL